MHDHGRRPVDITAAFQSEVRRERRGILLACISLGGLTFPSLPDPAPDANVRISTSLHRSRARWAKVAP